MKLGDTVRGNYCGTMIEGVINAFDGSGCIYITTAEPVSIFGSAPRTGFCFDRHDPRPKLVK